MLVGGRDCRTQFWKGITHNLLKRTIPPKFGLKWPSGFRGEYFSNCVRTDDRHKVMTKAHLGELKKKGGAYYFLSVVKSKKKSCLQQ